MPRKGPVAKRDVLPDPIYNSKLVTRLINRVMVDGKRGVAANIIYNAFGIIKESTGNDPLEVFEQAMKNIMPVLEVKARRVGGSNYQVPVEVRPERRTTLGLRWVVNYARLRGEHTMEERLAKRNHGCSKQHWCFCEETRRHTQNGGSQPRICSLSLVRSSLLFIGRY